MSDFLLELSPAARKLIKSLGLPLPMPKKLRRAAGPWVERPLGDARVLVGATAGASLLAVVAQTVAAAGGDAWVVGEGDAVLAPFAEPGEAYSRPATRVDGPPADGPPLDALIFDGSGIDSPAGLRALYDFFHLAVSKLRACGRVVVLARPLAVQRDAGGAAAQRALEGFVRSLAKEVGRGGSTVQLVSVDVGAEDRAEAVLRWLLSERAAFVTGQPIAVSAVAQAPPQVPRTRVLDGKVALVTGAARGIGKATAKLLAAEGAQVVCLDRPADDAPTSAVAREVGGTALLVDVSAADAPARICEALGERGVDVVVHNAGVTRDKTLAKMKPEQWDQALGVNLGAVVSISEALIDGPLHDFGRIICLSSVAGIAGNMGQTNYTTSKAGIIGLVEQHAEQLADRGITVNAIAPGFIETRLTAAIPVMIREAGRRMSSLGQGGIPEDVGQAITFLASPGAAGITGSVLRVCGGAMIGA